MARGFDAAAVRKGFAHPDGPPALETALRHAHAASLAARTDVPWEELRSAASAIKSDAMDHLDALLVEFEKRCEERGGRVLWAADAEEAVRHVVAICRRHEAHLAVKGKSMLSEEIGLSAALGAAGIKAVETDLGEFIVDLAGQRPSHIVGPALHLSRRDIGELFARRLGVPYTDDAAALMDIARRHLREQFRRAQVGITGCNFAIAETGTVVVVENEGNGGLAAGLPEVHVVLIGIEKVIPRVSDLGVFLPLLARAATGQKLTAYTHLFLGPPAGTHLYCILVDAGRTRLLGDPHARQALHCIRCGACLNACPVYRRVGGWAYGGTYGGPIGAVLTPFLEPGPAAATLAFASSLCGACSQTCPVKIDLAHQLVFLRSRIVAQRTRRNPLRAAGFRIWRWAISSLPAYRVSAAVLRAVLAIGGVTGIYPPLLRTWSRGHVLAGPPRRTFRQWWKKRRSA